MAYPFLVNSNGLDLLEVVQRLEYGILAEQKPTFEEVRQIGGSLIADVLRCWNGKHKVKFLYDIVLELVMTVISRERGTDFERALLGLCDSCNCMSISR